ncbi:hypothetical protein CHLRE_01g026350v5 [Chlamydomonas reinhardtii]|uniref:Uncharacterized protein n=1 Tax=Chlamydomonas reinhardtii TaxID=3055 RepID=A0A2K3E6L1_CHLRE|nr:uncharacterized protein CHLRE_01g026350v5 [Chlamydomonas reinhardtii]PNW88367.1 hypothetical protein CHLRE_01g026350v5 [Chlamydomonas reinhardtii]
MEVAAAGPSSGRWHIPTDPPAQGAPSAPSRQGWERPAELVHGALPPQAAAECDADQQRPLQQQPLTFSRWFARRTRRADIAIITVEALFMSWLHAARLGGALYCGEGAAAASSSAGSAYPCGGGLWSKLLWSLSSGAVLDPVLRLRMWDYGGLLYTWTHLAVVLIALLAPALYERCRHALMAGVGVAMLLGVHWSLWAAPSAALTAAAYYAAGRRRMGAVYMGWKSATVFRVPASAQLVTGPLLWLLMAAALPMTDRRMPPPGSDAGGGTDILRLAVQSLLSFVVIAVLPYVLCRVREARVLRPAYREYLRSCARATAGGGGEGGGAANDPSFRSCVESQVAGEEVSGSGRSSPTCATGGAAGGECMSSSRATSPSPSAYTSASASASGDSLGQFVAATAACRAPTPALDGLSRWAGHRSILDLPRRLPLPGSPLAVPSGLQPAGACAPVPTAHASADAPRSVLYRSHTMANGLLSRSRSALVSIKVPIRHRGSGSGSSSLARSAVESSSRDLLSFEQASALVLRCTEAALNTHNATQAQRRLQAAAPAAVPLRCLSAVCVEGCVQLLMVVHFVTAGAEEEGPGGQSVGQEAQGGGSSLHRSVHHVRLQPEQLSGAAAAGQVRKAAAGASAAVTAEGGAGDEERAMAAAAAAAVQQLLAHIEAKVEQMPAATGVSAASASNGPSVTAASTAAPAFCWPPALPLLTAAPGDAAAGAEVGGAAGEGDEAVVVLLQLPAGSARGLRSVRCVLAGPAAVPAAPEPGGDGAGAAAAVAYMDVELPLRLLQQPLAGGDSGGVEKSTVSAYVRLPVPPRARMGAGGLRMLHVLPPLGHDDAPSAEENHFADVTTTTIRPTWLAAEHGAEGTTAFPAASSLASSACGTAADAFARASTSTNDYSAFNFSAAFSSSANAAGTSSARSSMSGGPDSTAPLAVVPLLVVGSEAAAELQQLHGQVLGAAAVTQLHQLTTTAVAGAAVEAEGGSSHSAGEGLSGAAAALQHSGLTSLVLDFGALLQLPQSFAASGADADEAAITELAAMAFGDLLRFLAAQRMAGCRCEALAALQRAGVQLLLPGEDAQEEGGSEAAMSGGVNPLRAAVANMLPAVVVGPPLITAVAAAVEGSGATQASPPRAAHMSAAAGTVAVAAAAARGTDTNGVGGSSAVPSPASRPSRSDSGCCSGAATKLVSTATAAPAASGGTPQERKAAAVPLALPGQPGGRLSTQLVIWWLRVLAFGFPGPSTADSGTPGRPQQQSPGWSAARPSRTEAAYQEHKAAGCRALDRMALVIVTVFRMLSLLRTCTATARGSAATATQHTAVTGPAQPPAAGLELCAAAGGGCPRPYLEGRCGGLTGSQLEVIGQCLFLGAGMLGIALAACTRLHQRRRNTFLLLRAGLDAAVLLAMTLPLPRWPAPLLGLPAWWLENNRRCKFHCLVYCLFEPLTLQMSPYLQARLELIRFVPATLYEFYSLGCRWRPALGSGLAHAAAAILLSAFTDAFSRDAYMRRARGGRQ